MEKSKYMSSDELRELNARRVKEWEVPKDAVYVGQLWLPYGNEDFYRLSDGTYIYTYYSIGD